MTGEPDCLLEYYVVRSYRSECQVGRIAAEHSYHAIRWHTSCMGMRSQAQYLMAA